MAYTLSMPGVNILRAGKKKSITHPWPLLEVRTCGPTGKAPLIGLWNH